MSAAGFLASPSRTVCILMSAERSGRPRRRTPTTTPSIATPREKRTAEMSREPRAGKRRSTRFATSGASIRTRRGEMILRQTIARAAATIVASRAARILQRRPRVP